MACCWSVVALLSLISNEQQQQQFHQRPKLVIRRSNNKLSSKRHPQESISSARDDQQHQQQQHINVEHELAISPDDPESCAALLRSCARSGGDSRSIIACRKIDAHVQSNPALRSHLRLRNLLIHTYSRCGSLHDAHRAFRSIPCPNIFSWNIVLAAYARHGHPDRALQLFQSLLRKSSPLPDRFTYVTALRSCSLLGALHLGRDIHSRIIAAGVASDLIVATALLNMYAKCGCVAEARVVFDGMPDRDVVSWNSIISANALNGQYREALRVYKKMIRSSPVKPDAATFIAALDACADPEFMQDGVSIHARIIAREMEMDVKVATALLGMYSRCNRLHESVAVFERMSNRSLQSWTAMLGAFVHHREYDRAMNLSRRMTLEGVEADSIVFTILLNACGKLGAFEDGERIVDEIQTRKVAVNPVLAEAVMNMYTGCDKLSIARDKVVKQLSSTSSAVDDLHLWTALMVAYTRSGTAREALKVYGEMSRGILRPDRSCFMAVLDACGGSEALADGRVVHSQLASAGYESDPVVASAVMTMYSRCGSLPESEATFRASKQKNSVVLWTTMIAAYGQNRATHAAQQCFSEMCQSGVTPNRITLTTVLSVCRSVQQVVWYFNLVVGDFEEETGEEHYSCVVNLFGRVGKLDLAEELVRNMPFEPSSSTWMNLLDACSVHRDVKLGVEAAENVFRMEPRNGVAFLSLGKIYAQAEMWDEVAKLRKVMEDRGLRKGTHVNTAKTVAVHQKQVPVVQDEELTLRHPIYMLGPVGSG